MKKVIAVLLCICMLSVSVPLISSAIPLSSGTPALNGLFLDGECEGKYDYVSYSPVKGGSDTTKYPLFVWLHGMNSGTEPRAQLKWYHFSNWASDEYQARFADAGGCFLLAVRASGTSGNNWDGTMCPSLKATIDYFISLNADNIDAERISIGGYSTGGSMAWDMAEKYNDFFAAALPIASLYQPTADDLNNLKNVSVWMFSCDIDAYPISQSAETRVAFNHLKSITSRPEGVRMTSFSQAVFADGTKETDDAGALISTAEHYIWEAVTFDMHMIDAVTPYAYATTVDAAGNTISFDNPQQGIISWLSAQTKYTPAEDNPQEEIPNFFDSLELFFTRIFGYIKAFFEGMKKRFS